MENLQVYIMLLSWEVTLVRDVISIGLYHYLKN